MSEPPIPLEAAQEVASAVVDGIEVVWDPAAGAYAVFVPLPAEMCEDGLQRTIVLLGEDATLEGFEVAAHCAAILAMEDLRPMGDPGEA